MNYFLAFTLDREGYKSLPLCYGSYNDICTITSKLSSSSDIRLKYQKQIAEYQDKHRDYLDNIIKMSGRNYNGSIVIYENSKEGLPPYTPIRVLYKRDLIIFKIIMKTSSFVKKINAIDFSIYKKDATYDRLFSDFLSKKIHFDCDSTLCQRELNKWVSSLKHSPNCFLKVRFILKEYEKLHTKLGLPSTSQVYIEYLAKKKSKLSEIRDEVSFANTQTSNYQPLDVYMPDSDTYFSDEDLSAWKRLNEDQLIGEPSQPEKNNNCKKNDEQINGQTKLY